MELNQADLILDEERARADAYEEAKKKRIELDIANERHRRTRTDESRIASNRAYEDYVNARRKANGYLERHRDEVEQT